jgi:hypothetical protein
MVDNGDQGAKRFAVHSDDIRESFKLAFESVKHLTTLSASTLAVFATFLGSIFPSQLNSEVKVLIGLSFAFFIVSLVTSAFSLQRIAGLMRSRRQYSRKKQKVRWNILAPSLTYILGLSLFGTAVLLDLFFGGNGDNDDWKRFALYGVLVILLGGVIWWTIDRVRRGNKRDRQGEYEVMYPGVRDYDELVAREKPGEAFAKLDERKNEGGSPQRGSLHDPLDVERQQEENHEDQRSSFDIRQQVYTDLLSATHPYKLVVIGRQIPVNFLEFRDTVNKLEAQMLLLSPMDVQEKGTEMVRSFISCVTAKENQLKEERKEDDEREEPNPLEKFWTWLTERFLGANGQGEGRKGTDDLEEEMKELLKKELEDKFNESLINLSKARDEFVYVSQNDLARGR